MKKIFRVAFVVFIISFVFLIFINKDKKPTQQNIFRFSITSDPPTLDWSKATDHVSIDLIENIMEGLVQYDEKLQPIPAIAQSWDVSKDGKKYIFYLRKDVTWTDGVALTAHDFEYAWKRLLNPETAAEYAYFLFDVEGAEDFNLGNTKDPNTVGVRALNDSTLEVKLRAPASYFLHIPAFMVTYPMRKDVVEKHEDHWTHPENIITCGPFKLKEWQHKNKITLVKNEKYYDVQPKLEEIHALVVKNDQTAVDLYETGKIDILRKMPPLTIEQYKDHPQYINHPFLRGYYYGFNIEKKPFNDVRVRKAFAHAIDHKVFPEILKGGQIPVTSWVPPGMLGYEPDVGLGFNVELAQNLLKEAGYPDGKGFPKTIAFFDSRDDNKEIAEKLQQIWKENLNVHIDIENQEWKVYLKQLHVDPPPLFRLGWGADFPDPDNFLRLFTSNSGNNNTRWKSSSFDQLIFKAASEMNIQKRLELYKKAQKILLEEDVAIMPLFVESLNYVVKPHVKGLWVNSMERLILKKIWIDQKS
ncbi:MAG: peptide ABC transporter substrate-binding protein [Deltaproteobacteria bacterium]|nr:peptide ABC transporter substrate-binding protein [Deltaproteobacteria bacterium]